MNVFTATNSNLLVGRRKTLKTYLQFSAQVVDDLGLANVGQNVNSLEGTLQSMAEQTELNDIISVIAHDRPVIASNHNRQPITHNV